MVVDVSVLVDRTLWAIIGCGVGLSLGYTTRAREEAHEALEKVKNVTETRNDRTQRRKRRRHDFLWEKLPMIVVVLMTAVAALASAHTSDKVSDEQRASDARQACTTDTLFGIVAAVNERTAFSGTQAEANIALQNAQAAFIQTVVQDPATLDVEALDAYLDALMTYQALIEQTRATQILNPYPTLEEYSSCLNEAEE